MDSKCRLAVLTLVCLIAMNDSETNYAGVRGEEKGEIKVGSTVPAGAAFTDLGKTDRSNVILKETFTYEYRCETWLQ